MMKIELKTINFTIFYENLCEIILFTQEKIRLVDGSI